MRAELDNLLARVGQMVGELEANELPDLMGHLEALRAGAWASLGVAVKP